MKAFIAQTRKAIGAAVAAGITLATLITQSPSGPITPAEWIACAVAASGVLAVYGLTNDQQ